MDKSTFVLKKNYSDAVPFGNRFDYIIDIFDNIDEDFFSIAFFYETCIHLDIDKFKHSDGLTNKFLMCLRLQGNFSIYFYSFVG